jgi:hypothetical protein
MKPKTNADEKIIFTINRSKQMQNWVMKLTRLMI